MRFPSLAAAATFALAATLVLASPLPHSTRTKTHNKPGSWIARAEYFHFRDASPVVRLANTKLEVHAQEAVDKFVKDATDFLKDPPRPDREMEFDEKAVLSLGTQDLISVYGDGYLDFAGAHPSQYYSSHAYGLVHGRAKELALKDLFLPGTNVATTVSRKVLPKLKASHASMVEDASVTALSADDLKHFAITTKGLNFLFEDGAVGSHAEGEFIVKLPFSAFKGKLDPDGPLKPLLPARPAVRHAVSARAAR